MQRPVTGILPKLSSLGFIHELSVGQSTASYRIMKQLDLTHLPTYPQLTEEKPVKNYETMVLIQGQDASGMTDDEIFELILELESKIRKLNAIEFSSKKVNSAIGALKEDIANLVMYLDGR
jgi:hypothetical protein